MIYCVDHRMDKITKRDEPRPVISGMEMYAEAVFRTEAEARNFIIVRSIKNVERAEKVMKNAKANQAKCWRKFGWWFGDKRKLEVRP